MSCVGQVFNLRRVINPPGRHLHAPPPGRLKIGPQVTNLPHIRPRASLSQYRCPVAGKVSGVATGIPSVRYCKLASTTVDRAPSRPEASIADTA
jgi:hypothetical protein